MRLDAVVDVRLGDLELGDQLGDEELVVLERADRLAERLALLDVVDGLDAGSAAAWAMLDTAAPIRSWGSRSIMCDEAAVDLADHVRVRHPHVGEEQLGGVGLVLADLVQLAAPLEARHAGLDGEQGDAPGPLLRGRARGHDDQVGGVAVGDERLGPVEDPVVAVAHRGRLQRRPGPTRRWARSSRSR